MSIDIKRLDLEHLYLFQLLYQERNVSRIAEIMDSPQPTVSRKLGSLRKITGDQLFVPTNQGMEPTLYSIRIAPMVSDVLTGIESAFGDTHTEAIPRDHQFNIGMVDTAVHICASKLTNHCEAEGANLSLNFDPIGESNDPSELKRVVSKLKTGQLDYVVHTDEAMYEDRSIEGVELFSSRYVMISKTPRRADNNFPEQIGLQEFLELPFADVNPIPIQRFLERKKKHRNIRTISPNHDATASIILASRLFGLVPEVLLPKFGKQSSGLRVTRLDFDPPQMRVSMFWLKKNRTVSHNCWMRELIQHQCESIRASVR